MGIVVEIFGLLASITNNPYISVAIVTLIAILIINLASTATRATKIVGGSFLVIWLAAIVAFGQFPISDGAHKAMASTQCKSKNHDLKRTIEDLYKSKPREKEIKYKDYVNVIQEEAKCNKENINAKEG